MPSSRITHEVRKLAAISHAKKLNLEPYLASDMRRAFKQMIRSFMITYPANKLTIMPTAYYADVTGHLRDHYRRTIKKFMNFYRDSKRKQKARERIPDDEINRMIELKMNDYVLEHSEKQAKVIIRTTEHELRTSINKIVANASKEGRYIDSEEIAKLVASDYTRKISGRANIISITETQSLAEKTKIVEIGSIKDLLNDNDDDTTNDVDSENGASSSSPAFSRIWVAILDNVTRDAHAEADGQEVSEGESFTVDGEDLEYPGDPNGSPENIINCRCNAVPITQ